MVGLGPHQASPHQAESANSQRQDDFLNLEQERDIERAMYTPPIRAKATLKWEVTYLKGKIATKPRSWR